MTGRFWTGPVKASIYPYKERICSYFSVRKPSRLRDMGFFKFFTVAEEFLVSREAASADDAADVEEIFLTCSPANPQSAPVRDYCVAVAFGTTLKRSSCRWAAA